MTKNISLTRFIPFSKKTIFEACLKHASPSLNKSELKQFHQLLGHLFHFEFYQINEALKESYTGDSKHRFIDLLNGLLNKANYERISQQDLNTAMDEASLFKIKLEVNFDEFSEVLLFCRGESLKTETLKTWFGLKQKTIEFSNYDHVVVYLKFNAELTQSNNSLSHEPNSTVLKLFKNVPKADLEMLFPNTQVRMRLSDKLFIGIPALISGGIVVSTKLGASILIIMSLMSYWLGVNQDAVDISKTEILALIAGFGALGGYLWKQYSNFKNRKLRFLQSLTQNLYFKNLDNNKGVFHRLIDEAEEEEVKEAFLAYFFLLQNKDGMIRSDLDEAIESWFKKTLNRSINFEIDDALNKLLALKIITLKQDILKAEPLSIALKLMDQRWDNYFKYK